MKDQKEQILEALTGQWKATSQINFEVQGIYYQTLQILRELNEEELCDHKLKGKRTNLWRKPLLPDKLEVVEGVGRMKNMIPSPTVR